MTLKLNPITGELDLVGSGGGGGSQTDLTGDTGGAVSPDGSDSISVIGDATQAYITTTGTPASNKLEIKLLEPAADGELLIGHTANAEPSVATLTAGSGIDITNAAGSITIASTATSSLSVPTDSGTAEAVAGVMSFVGGTGADTVGSGNTVIINASANVPTSFTTDSGTGTPVGNSLAVNGGTGINTSGAGAGVTVNIDSPVTPANGGTGSTSFTAGSVIFSNGSIITEDNSNLFWDDTNNRLGLGTTTPLDTLHIVGNMDLHHTAAENDDHAFEIECNASGFGDVKALDIDYITGAIVSTQYEECILINIDETLSTGGQVSGLHVLTTTEGSADIVAVKSGPGVEMLHHESGTFGNMDSALNKAVDVLAALSSGGAGNITLFVADNDTFTIGDAASFGAMEVIINTGASGAGIAPTFEYSTGSGTWAEFSPADGTNSFRNTGVLEWDVADLAGFAVGVGGEYLIRTTRTKNSLSTAPIVDLVQIAALTEFKWDKDGAVNFLSLVLTTDLAVAHGGTGASTLTDGGVLLGSGTGAVTALGQATNGQLVIGSTGTDPVIASVTGTGISVTEGAGTLALAVTGGGLPWTDVTGTSQAMAVDSGYFANNAGLVTLTLPDTAAQGSVIRVAGVGAGGWSIAQNAGENIKVTTATSTTGIGGSVASSDDNDCIEIVCITANTSWLAISMIGNLTVT